MIGQQRTTQTGFTLIELMIVVAIVGIIAAIAYPSYQSVMAGSYRSAAQADLMSFAAAMERHHSGTFSYEGGASGGANTGAPAVFASHSPASEPASNKRYNLTIEQATGIAFQLKATPVTGSAVETDGALFYFSDGRKAWDKDNNGTIGAAEYCWSC
ncbi:prepilin-type N-terminal cleavage/methylation domain-containing protein [Alteromonas ponticola]|uniref:Prepilin-type N-terminal cleavage/methylation domain-containing protein n=1 Tax=Alteromonas aquimaris TaxID=2998417 RepID=A0ABT3P3L7_9ALTE|nr:type IV pilin protein [Alteromonas aquimaris]MCW8107367.1 prepilin-type N-terminal cleavage/methylation domain-containing protein [Alteromonas aquimaris]